MNKTEIKRYLNLNEIAEHNGIVIFGGSEDLTIPLGELMQAFSIEERIYNRSIVGLSVNNAVEVFDECVAPLTPQTILIHIGKSDLEFFETNPTEFDVKYCELINHIKAQNKKSQIAVVSLKNYDNNPLITELNKHLKYIAHSERCEYGDIANKKVWNPKSTKDAVSFVYSIGFVHPLKNKRPLYDLIKMLFCWEA